jgi:hypothetical protein
MNGYSKEKFGIKVMGEEPMARVETDSLYNSVDFLGILQLLSAS